MCNPDRSRRESVVCEGRVELRVLVIDAEAGELEVACVDDVTDTD